MTTDDRRRLDELGYVVLPPPVAIPHEILAYLELRFEQAGENAGHALRDEPFARSVAITPDRPGFFAPLTSDPRVLACAEHLLGSHVELAALRGRSSNPFALASDTVHPGPTAPVCKVIWMLDDFAGAGAAALRVVPGSHRVDVVHDERSSVEVTGPAGSAVVLNGSVWRCDAANPGNRHLRTLRCEYIRRAARVSG